MILGFADDQSNAAAACVCKGWTEFALANLWRVVADLRVLFRLLAPMKPQPPSGLIFSRPIEPADWERFNRYARRVRTLRYSAHCGVSPQAFDDVARTRRELNILPNLERLEWVHLDSEIRPKNEVRPFKSVEHETTLVELMRLSTMFMHSNINRLDVEIRRLPNQSILPFFQDILLRVPNLKELDLRFAFPVHEIEPELVDLLTGLPLLKTCILPLYSVTSKVMEALSKLPSVATVQFEFLGAQGRGSVDDVMKFQPRLRNAFPALHDLSFSANLSDAQTFLSGEFAPTHLTTLYVHNVVEPSPESVTNLLKTIRDNCPLLETLALDYLTPVARAQPRPREESLNWKGLRTVLEMPNLVAFELRWDSPLVISEADVEELASKWPSLETLLLNCEPMDPSTGSTLTLRALFPFTRHCPKLRELGLFVTAANPNIDIGDTKPFPSLEKLCMGLSDIEESGPVALFLSQLLPLGCDVSSGVTWPEGFGVAETDENAERIERIRKTASNWYDKWTMVNEMLPLFTKLRVQERETYKKMGQELEQLRSIVRQMREGREGPSRPTMMSGDESCVAM